MIGIKTIPIRNINAIIVSQKSLKFSGSTINQQINKNSINKMFIN